MNTKEYLKIICHQRGMEFKDLAEKMGVSRASLSQMINREVVTVKALKKIAVALDMTYEDLTAQLGSQTFSTPVKHFDKIEQTCDNIKEVLEKCHVPIMSFPFHIVEEYARKNNFQIRPYEGIDLFSYLHVGSERYRLDLPVVFLAAVELLREKNLPGAKMFLYFHIDNANRMDSLVQRDTYVSSNLNEIYALADYIKEQLEQIVTKSNANK